MTTTIWVSLISVSTDIYLARSQKTFFLPPHLQYHSVLLFIEGPLNFVMSELSVKKIKKMLPDRHVR